MSLKAPEQSSKWTCSYVKQGVRMERIKGNDSILLGIILSIFYCLGLVGRKRIHVITICREDLCILSTWLTLLIPALPFQSKLKSVLEQ